MAKRALRANSPAAVRAALVKVANEVRMGELTPQQANAITASMNCILQSIRLDEQQTKIDELEMMLREQREGV